MPKSQVQAVHMLMESSLLDQINEYRFRHRFKTRIETIKFLISSGLKIAPLSRSQIQKSQKV